MTTMSSSVPRVASRRFHNWLSAALLVSAAVPLLLAYSGASLSGVFLMALVPVVLAAYSRRGMLAVGLVLLFLDSALAPAVLAMWGTPAFRAEIASLFSHTVVLGLFGILAANLSRWMRSRREMTGAIQEREALLARATDIEQVVAFLRQEARTLTQAQSAAMIVHDQVRGQWHVAFDNETVELDASKRTSLATWLTGQSEPLIVEDVFVDPRFAPHPGRGAGAPLALLAYPLLVEGKGTMAVIVLLDRSRTPFVEEDVETLKPLATAGLRALAQAERYAQADQTLARRMHQLNALQRAAQELNEILDLEEIARRALRSGIEITDADAGLIGVAAVEMAPIYSLWHTAAEETIVEQFMNLAPNLPPALRVVADDYSVPALLPETAVRLAVPIRREGQTLGVLVLESNQPQAFGPEAQRSVASLTDHAAVALENAQLLGEVRRQKQRSEQMVANMTDGLLTVTSDGLVATINHAAEVLTAWRAEEAIGHPICEVFGCKDQGQCTGDCRLKAAVDHSPRVYEDRWLIRPRWGGERIMELRAAPLAGGSDPSSGLVVLIHDISDKWRMEQFQRDLIATFSHELRTPLANISAITQIMAEEQATVGRDGQSDEQLEMLQAQSARLGELANRFMDLSRIETGDLRLELRPLPIAQVIGEVVSQWRSTQHHHGLELVSQVGSAWVWADEQALRTVVDSLIDNAIKYTPANLPVQVIIARPAADMTTITVKDTGPGIAAEDQDRVFERFQRLDSSDARRVYGYGLGLYIARILVEGMGGSIQVWSEPGHGSEFTLALPTWEEDDGEIAGH